jgi:hypothetical protein
MTRPIRHPAAGTLITSSTGNFISLGVSIVLGCAFCSPIAVFLVQRLKIMHRSRAILISHQDKTNFAQQTGRYLLLLRYFQKIIKI